MPILSLCSIDIRSIDIRSMDIDSIDDRLSMFDYRTLLISTIYLVLVPLYSHIIFISRSIV
jgi:hypothetical protein